MKLTKKKIIAIISSVVMIATLICAMAMISSAATFELPDEGMSFQRDTVYQMYENLTVSEDLTIETEFWINPAPNDNTRYGAMISNVVTNPSSSQKQYMLEMYSFGRLRFWTDDVNYYLFNYDIRTAVTQSKFVKAAITVDVYTTATTVTQADGTTVTAYGAVSLYIDGEYKETVYATSKKFVPGWFSTSTPLCIGGDKRDNNPYSFMGAIKNVTLYSDVRTAEEIKTSYQATTYSESFDASDDALLVAYDLTADMFYDDLSQNGNNLRFISPEGKSFTAEENQLYLDKPLTETPRTYEAVIYAPTEAGSERTGVIFGNYDWTSSGELRCLNFEIFDNGAPSLYIKDSTGVSKPRFKSSSSKVIREGWVHLVIVDDGTKYYCYIDGELTETITHKAASGVDSYEYDISSVQADTTLSIAQDTRPEKLFKGKIKYIAYYSEPLTAEEIKTSYEKGVNSNNEDLILYYEMNDGETKNVVKDLSGNNYHASCGYYEREETKEYAYSFAVVGDTQMQVLKDWKTATDSEVGNETNYTEMIYQWLVDNKDKKNIQWVFGVGDITENNGVYNNSTMLEWDIAKAAILKLDEAGMNYSVILGNHDTRGGTTDPFNQYFADPSDDFYTKRVTSYYEEGKLDNYYMNFEVAGVKYMMLGLEFGPNDKILAWASDVIDSHPDRRVIVTTHAYLYSDGTTVDKDDPVPPNTSGEIYKDTDKNNGDMMWDKFISRHRNIFMVLSGHESSSDVVFRQDRGVNDNLVSQFLIDPQNMAVDTGMICMLYFSEDGKDVSVEWISTGKTQAAQAKDPSADDILYKATNQFDFKLYDSYNNFVYSSGIVEEESDATKTVYRIYYTNGTYSEFVINHGQNGENGQSVTVVSVEKTSSEGLVDTYTITFSDGTTSTFTVTNGKDGADGVDGADGKDGVNGTDGEDGKDGTDGKDGQSVTVVSVEKTSSEGLVDTYTITFSDGTTATFTVTNGTDGKDGADGKDGKDGKDGVDGKDGKDGKDGTDYKDDISITEEEPQGFFAKIIAFFVRLLESLGLYKKADIKEVDAGGRA